MDPVTISVIGVIVLIILLVMGMNIGISMMTVGFFGFMSIRGFGPALNLFKGIPFTQATNYSFTVIPLFILMGQFAYFSGMSSGLYDMCQKWFGNLKGGLAMATVAACAGFSAICGSTAATAATMGVVALPEMRRHGYDGGLACGSIAAGGTLGILIPPSTGFIIYGIVAGESIGALFAAGIIPGIILATCYIISIAITVKIKPDLAPGKVKYPTKEKLISLKGGLPMVVLFVIVIGGIFGGLFTANIVTVAWTGTINSSPSMVSISLRKERLSYDLIKETGEFAINLVSEQLVLQTDFCGVNSGRNVDKFEATGLTAEKASVINAPIIKESPVSLECVVKDTVELGSHVMFLAEIVSVNVEDSLIDEKGKPQMDKANLVCYMNRQYWSLGEYLGSYGYSASKK
jgi:TRAP-type mannitol/chloroaromatic compound transport system permease large subunit